MSQAIEHERWYLLDGDGIERQDLVLVSVIIPALNEAKNIADCIRAAERDYDEGEVEIVVVDGGSTDDTRRLIPGEVTVLQSERGRAAQMNRGAGASNGDILLFCHADTRLPYGWRPAVIQALDQPGVVGGAFQVTYSPPKGILHLINRLTFKGNWRAIHGDRAQFTTRETFEAVGGFPEIPLMEDVELSRALHQRGDIVLVPDRVVTSSRRFVENGPLRQYLLSVWFMIRYLYLGATPEQIARAYRSSRERALSS
jgi:rSAM/selenodomain-associated transferase 2